MVITSFSLYTFLDIKKCPINPIMNILLMVNNPTIIIGHPLLVICIATQFKIVEHSRMLLIQCFPTLFITSYIQ